jgi:4-amino-4-deoxychorismate lyase
MLDAHIARLGKACTLLRIPLLKAEIESDLKQLLALSAGEGICKIILTRGEGGRGYIADLSATPTRIVQFFEQSLHSPHSHGIVATVSRHRLGQNHQLAGLKHLNRLDQVMASFDLTPGIGEVICLDQQGLVIEGSRSNLILVEGGRLFSPSLATAGVRGIMLEALAARFAAIGKPIEFTELSLDDIYRCSELFFCNSVFGVWPVIKLCEGANVRQWAIGELGRQAKAFQDELFGTKL